MWIYDFPRASNSEYIYIYRGRCESGEREGWEGRWILDAYCSRIKFVSYRHNIPYYCEFTVFPSPSVAIEKDDVGLKDLPPTSLFFVVFILPLPCFAKSSALSSLTFPRFRPEYLFGERSANDLINPWKAQFSVALSPWAEQLRSRKENNYRYRAFCLSSTLHPTFNVKVSTRGESPHFLSSPFLR